MSAVHASVPMVDTSGGVLLGDPPNLSALGKALGQTVISSPSGSASHELGVSTAASTTTPSNSTRKSPKKRERTDSMKTMTPAPAAQRAKSDGAAFDNGDGDDDDDDDGEGDDDDDEDGDDDDADDGHAGEEEYSDTSSTAADGSGIKLPVKDRTGSAIAGVSRVALISNAVKTAPPAKEKSNPRRWSKLEDESLRLAVERSGERNWKAIAEQVPGRNHTQCLQRWTKVLKPGLIKGHWDPEEDIKLRDLVSEGKRNWGQVASLIPGRTSKQCRERWCNHLDPNINKGMYTEEEDRIIMEMQAKLGNRWSIIAQHLKGRTEDAVKIRWKSLMRGKKAAGKEAQQAQASATASAASLTTTNATTATDTNSLSVAVGATTKASDDKTRVKAARTPTRQKTRAASPVDKPLEPIAFKSDPTVPPAPQPIYLPPGGGSADNSSTSTTLDSKQVAASINSYVQNVNDLVAASIQNYRLGQNFSPALPTTTNVGSIPTSTAPVTSNSMLGPGHAAMMSQSTITSMNQPVYTMATNQGYPGMPLSQSQRQFFGMQPNMNLPPNYVLPTTSTGQPFPVAMPSSNGAMHPVSITGYGQYGQAMMNDGRAMGMPPGYGPGGVPIGPQVGISYVNGSVPMGAPAYAMAPVAGVPPTHPSIGGHGEPLAPVSASAIPAHVMSSQSSRLATPREEWGSSQTPRSHLIMEEGHASAYELFHQQRLRLMLKEREKGMSLTSAPSPGQAMLTKELKANKERQKRQEMMQKGWKTAVEAMMLNNDTPSLDDSDIMEKVGLSALDPTDDELMDSGVEITLAADDTIVDGDETPLLVDQD